MIAHNLSSRVWRMMACIGAIITISAIGYPAFIIQSVQEFVAFAIIISGAPVAILLRRISGRPAEERARFKVLLGVLGASTLLWIFSIGIIFRPGLESLVVPIPFFGILGSFIIFAQCLQIVTSARKIENSTLCLLRIGQYLIMTGILIPFDFNPVYHIDSRIIKAASGACRY